MVCCVLESTRLWHLALLIINGVKYMVYARTAVFDRYTVHPQLNISYVSP